MRLEDFDFSLPTELIAQEPVKARSASRLLLVSGDYLGDCHVVDLPGLLVPGDLLVFNDTRVVKARLLGRKDTGGQVEILIERVVDSIRAVAQLRASHAPKPGSKIYINDQVELEVGGREEEFFELELVSKGSFQEVLDRHGTVPLPPYIMRDPVREDEVRYQTVYAREAGAVAAPTAGLHFDEALLHRLAEQGIERAFLTLHVGAGTFQPVRVSNLEEHRMHREHYFIPKQTVDAIELARSKGRKVVAVGTTTVRALESAALFGDIRAGAGESSLFIRPGFAFRVVDRLMTNFHLPKSTLLVLASAFAGCERVRAAYRHAIERRYRFFSYGDAMLLDRDR